MVTNQQFSLKKLGFFSLFIMLVFSVFLQANELTSEFITAFYPAVFIICIMALYSTPILSEIKLNNKNVIITLLFFIGVNFLSVFWSVYPAQSLWEASKLLLYFFIFMISSQALTDKDGLKLIKIMLFVGVFEVVLPIYDFLIVKKAAFTLATYSGRAMGSFPGPNAYGIFLAMIFLMAAGCFSEKMTKRNITAFYFNMAVLVCGIVLSGSRGVWISFIISLGLFFISARLSNRKRILISAILAAGLIMALGIIRISSPIIAPVSSDQPSIPTAVSSSAIVNRIQLPADKLMSLNSRIPIWEAAVEMCLSKPLTGYGLGTFERMYGTFQLELKEYPNYAHNHYLQVFAETGIISFCIFLLFCFYNLKLVYSALRTRDSFSSGMAAAVIAFTLHIFIDFDWNFFAVTILFFFILGSLYGRLATGEKTKFSQIRYTKTVRNVMMTVVLFMGIVIVLQLANHYELNQGDLHLRKGQIGQAKEKAAAAARILPIDPMAYMLQAHLSLKDGTPDLQESILYIEKATELDPYNAWNFNQLGLLMLYTGEEEKGIQNLEKSLLLNRSELKYYLDLGRALIKNNKPDEAEDILVQGYELRAGVPKYFFDQTKEETTEKTLEIAAELMKIYLRTDIAKADEVRKTMMQEYPEKY